MTTLPPQHHFLCQNLLWSKISTMCQAVGWWVQGRSWLLWNLSVKCHISISSLLTIYSTRGVRNQRALSSLPEWGSLSRLLTSIHYLKGTHSANVCKFENLTCSSPLLLGKSYFPTACVTCGRKGHHMAAEIDVWVCVLLGRTQYSKSMMWNYQQSAWKIILYGFPTNIGSGSEECPRFKSSATY